MSLLRCFACFLVLIFFAVCGVSCERTAAGYDLHAWSRKSGAHLSTERSLKTAVEGGSLDGDADSVRNRHILQQKKSKDEAEDEEDAKSEDKEDDGEKKQGGAKSDSEAKKPNGKKEAKTEEDTDAEADLEKEAEAPAEAEKEAEAEKDVKKEAEAKAKAKKDVKAVKEVKAGKKVGKEAEDDAEAEEEAEIEADADKEAEKEAEAEDEKETKAKAKAKTETKANTDTKKDDDGAKESEKIVKSKSEKKDDSDAKEEEKSSKSSTKKDGKSVDKVPEKEEIEADSDAGSGKRITSENKDRKSEGKSDKGVDDETAEKDEADDSSETDSAKKKSVKKRDVNKSTKEKKDRVKMAIKSKKGAPKSPEPKKKPAPVVKKKVRPTLPSDCVWDNDTKSCFVDREPFSKILSRTKSKSGKVLLGEYECLGLDQVRCNVLADGCEWIGSCHSSAYIKAQEKCFGSGVPFIDHMDGTCERHSDASSCSLNDKCTWVSSEERCAVDFIKAFTGLSLDGQEVRDTRDARKSELQTMFNVNAANFILNPDSILDWTLPDFNCPDGVDKATCEFAMAFDEEFVLNVHCGAKYDINDISDCNLDPLCEISIDGACGISPVKQQEVAIGSSKVLANAAKSKLGTQYIELISACQEGPSNVEGEGCPSGCLLDGEACFVDTDAFIQEEVLTSKSFKNGQCKGFPSVHQDAGCEDLDKKACRAASNCSLDADDVCSPDEKAIVLGALLGLEPPVASAVKAASTKCSSFKTQSKCEKPKVL